jgi:tRNA A64-2'-O-ribosylphosphate transferase
MWISPASQPSTINLTELDFFPVICVSASKLVEDAGGVERRLGYTYVQGSGDDHELWSGVG